MTRELWLDLHESESPHNDVVLTLGASRQTEDSYYFTLDPNVNPGDESAAKAARVMVALLDQWLDRLASGEATYLPVGFSDQSMSWLLIEPAGDDTRITLGWSEDEGWSITASDLGDTAPATFSPTDDAKPVVVYTPRLLSLIRSNRSALAAEDNT